MTGDGATTPEEAPGTAEELELADKELDGVAGSECYGIKRPKRGSASISCVTGPGGVFRRLQALRLQEPVHARGRRSR